MKLDPMNGSYLSLPSSTIGLNTATALHLLPAATIVAAIHDKDMVVLGQYAARTSPDDAVSMLARLTSGGAR